MVQLAEPTMAKKTIPVRITEGALKIAQAASGFSGETPGDWISALIELHGPAEVERLHKEWLAELNPGPKKPRAKDQK